MLSQKSEQRVFCEEEEVKGPEKGEHFYKMYVGHFVQTENSFRMRGLNQGETILDFILLQKQGAPLLERRKIKCVRAKPNQRKLRHQLTNPWDFNSQESFLSKSGECGISRRKYGESRISVCQRSVQTGCLKRSQQQGEIFRTCHNLCNRTSGCRSTGRG